MLKETFIELIGNEIVATGRAIKVHNLNMYSKNNFEITPEQYVVLNMLKSTSLSQNKLCILLYKDKSNMARIISILEEKGLIEKNTGIENKKQVNKISITEKGRNLTEKIAPVMETSRKEYLKEINEDEMFSCIKVLEKIRKNLEKELE